MIMSNLVKASESSCWGSTASKQPRSSMILKYLAITHVTPKRFDRRVPAHVHHLEHGSAVRCGGRQEAGSQGVARERLVIQANSSRHCLEDVRDRTRR